MVKQQELAPEGGAALRLTTLGGAALDRVSGGSGCVALFGAGKPLALLSYLASSPGRSASRDHLIDLLWGDVDPDRARHALRHTLWLLRDHLGETALEGNDDDLRLGAAVESDRDAFLAAVERCEFEQAVELYGGDFLPGFAAPGAAEFEQWADRERFRLRHMFLRAAEGVVRDWLAKGRLRKARQLASRVRDLGPHNEAAWRLLLEALLAASDTVAAELEAHELEQVLRAEGRPPEPATLRLLERVRAKAGEEEGPAARAPDQGLVAELIGREREFGAILGAWERARRGAGQHVHVTGAAGLGKTRLLSDVQARLRAMGVRAITVRANPGERQVSYAFASEVVRAAADLPGATGISPAVAGALVALDPSLSARFTAAADRSVDAEALRRREIALGELMGAVAYEQPVAALLDDVHWADSVSRQLLRSQLEKLGDHHVLVVTAARPGLEGSVTNEATTVVALEPLSVEETGALAASLGVLPGDPWSGAFPAALHEATNGSPLLILETLRLALESEVLALRDGAWVCRDPAALTSELARGGALRRRIEELGRNEGWLLLLLAVAGTPLDAALLARAAGRNLDAVRESLALLEVRGLASREADDWQPAHDEIAARAVEVASREGVRAAHRAVGEALAESGRDDANRLFRAARHLAAAGSPLLRGVFGRWAAAARRAGDGRSLRALAADVVGDAGDPEGARRLARAAPLRLRVGLHTRARVAAAATAALLAGASVATLLLKATPPPPDAVLLVAARGTADRAVAYAVPLLRDRWERVRSIDAASAGRPYPEIAPALAPGTEGALLASPRGGAWVFTRVVADSGGYEIFLLDEHGGQRRLTFAPKDDWAGPWSPDGRQIVFSTCRWNPHCWGDLAVMDVASGRVRQLTRGDDSDGEARWSPDGTRIAFLRHSIGQASTDPAREPGPRFCWITADGKQEHCFRTDLEAHGLVGWYDRRQLLVTVADGVGGVAIARVHLDSSDVHVLRRGVAGAVSASENGLWIGCACDRSGTAGTESIVFPTERPDLAVRVTAGKNAEDLTLLWTGRGAPASYLDRLEIARPAVPVSLGSPERLRALGFDASGGPTPVEIVSWQSEDTAVATVDRVTGELRPRAAGTVVVRASAGGWRADSLRVLIEPATFRTARVEEWGEPLDSAWISYGDPLPAVTRGPDGRPAFWNRGDGSFYSGAYSRGIFSARRGLGVELTMFSPMTALQDQLAAAELVAWTDTAALRRWDHRTGGRPWGSAACGVGYPAGDGRANLQRMIFHATPGGRVVIPGPAVQTGRPYLVRLQIFPDGRCGVAVNGTPLWLANSTLPTDAPYRLDLEGKSVGNRMLVGRVEVWEGVKTGINWAAAPR